MDAREKAEKIIKIEDILFLNSMEIDGQIEILATIIGRMIHRSIAPKLLVATLNASIDWELERCKKS